MGVGGRHCRGGERTSEVTIGTAALKIFLEGKFKDLDSDITVVICQWQTTDRSTLYTQTASLEEYKDLVISSINSLTAHSFIA